MAGPLLDVWDEERDGSRTWELSSWTARRPVPMLERDILVRFIAAMRHCHETSGLGFGQDAIRFVAGYCYTARSEEPEEQVAARRRAYVARIHEVERTGNGFYDANVRPALEARLRELRVLRRGATNLPTAVSWLAAAIDAAASAMGDLHWRMADPTPFDWPATFAEITGRAPVESSILLKGLGHDTARLVARLRDLATEARDEPGLLDALTTDGDLSAFPRFRARLARLLRDHGRRTGFGAGSAATFHTPTWSMRPQLVRDLIASFARADLAAVDAAERRARSERVALARRIRRSLAADPDRLARFEAAYDRAVKRVLWGENSNRLIEQETVGTMREAAARVGSLLVRDHGLASPDDVFHLSLADLEAVASGALSDVGALVEARRAELDELGAAPPARTLGKPPGSAPSQPPASMPPSDASRLRGAPVSPGRVSGTARVVAQTPEPPEVRPGDILVARDAGPAWTPVFPLIAGLVLDTGSLEDHAAIMARDLAIPAVMRVPGATSTISDGARVTVDGTAGTVDLHED